MSKFHNDFQDAFFEVLLEIKQELTAIKEQLNKEQVIKVTINEEDSREELYKNIGYYIGRKK